MMNFGIFFVVIGYLLIFVTIIRIFLRENRTPASRVAWILVVALFPYFGVLLYFLLGETYLGRNYNRRLAALLKTLYRHFYKKAGGDWELSKPLVKNPNYNSIFSYSCSISGLEPTAGNQGYLLKDAKDTVESIIHDIDQAEHSVHGLYYIWLADNTGRALAEALIRASKRGVNCRVLADGMGSRQLFKSQIWRDMEEAGVQAEITLPLKYFPIGLLASRFDLRNHRKITVIDNKITYIGSRNIADPSFDHKAKYAPWVDIMARFEGPIAKQNNIVFISDWMMATGDDEVDELFDATKNNVDPNGFVANIAPDGPTMRFGAIPQLFETMFSAANEKLIITTPYFVPSEGLVDAICARAYAGVDVKMILPKRNDSLIVGATSRSHYKELLEAGVRIFEYRDGLLHSKIVTVDGHFSMIGSSNLDRRSFDLNYENNIILEDDALTNAIVERQESYLAQSDEVLLKEVENWGLFKRLANNVLAVLSPIL